jgi:DNA-binding NtrC family response regulator
MARILVADDESSVRDFLARALERYGHTVETAADGSEALVALAQTPFDLLLTDIVMPVMDGIALALKATSEHPDLIVLMMTGYAAEKQRAHNLDALIHDVVMKPFSMNQILDAVQRALQDAPGRRKPEAPESEAS